MGSPRFHGLSDPELHDGTLALRASERELCVELLLHLVENEERKLYLRLGYPTLFAYCVDALGYSEGAAWRRVSAARAMQAFPTLETAIRDGDISLCVAAEAARVLTPENHVSLLARLRKRTVQEARAILAPWLPRQTVPDRLQPLGGEGETRYRVEFEADAELHDMLQRVRELLSNKYPQGVGLACAIKEMANDYLQKHDPLIRTQRRARKIASMAPAHHPAKLSKRFAGGSRSTPLVSASQQPRIGDGWRSKPP